MLDEPRHLETKVGSAELPEHNDKSTVPSSVTGASSDSDVVDPFTVSIEQDVWQIDAVHRNAVDDIKRAFLAAYPRAESKLVMVTVANEAFHQLLMNWIAFVKPYGIPIVVGALDDAIIKRCEKVGVPAVSLQHAGFDTSLVDLDVDGVKNLNFRGSQRGFQNYGVRKLALLLTLLEMGLDVSLSDTDVVWMKSPQKLFSRKSGTFTEVADVLVTSDCLSQAIDEKLALAAALKAEDGKSFNYKEWACSVGGPEPWEDNASPLTSRINTGVTFFRSTVGGKAMAKRWIKSLVKCFDGDNPGCDDQTSFNAGTKPGARNPVVDAEHNTVPVKGGEGRVFWSDLTDGRCAMGILPISDFSNGHVYFLQKVPHNLKKQPFAVHNTHNFYGAAGKLYRFRAAHLWRLDEGTEEYSTELKYLTFDSHSGELALKHNSPLVAHIVARDELRRELWAAVALAKLLNRVLVLPRHRCFCDRYWYPILPQCRLPGSQPYNTSQACPLDQILDVGALWDKNFPVQIRVDSFLENPAAQALLASHEEMMSTDIDGSPVGDTSLKCLSPSQVSTSLRSAATVLRIKGGVRGLFCGYHDGSPQAKELDDAIGSVFKRTDWCCHQNGSMPIQPHHRTRSSPAGAIDAGPREDTTSIDAAKHVWDITNPEGDKWQARIFGHRFEPGTEMAQHNHYSCT